MPPEPQTSGKEPSAGAMRAAVEIFNQRNRLLAMSLPEFAQIIDRESGLADLIEIYRLDQAWGDYCGITAMGDPSGPSVEIVYVLAKEMGWTGDDNLSLAAFIGSKLRAALSKSTPKKGDER